MWVVTSEPGTRSVEPGTRSALDLVDAEKQSAREPEKIPKLGKNPVNRPDRAVWRFRTFFFLSYFQYDIFFIEKNSKEEKKKMKLRSTSFP
jgi:hypothetical protein